VIVEGISHRVKKVNYQRKVCVQIELSIRKAHFNMTVATLKKKHRTKHLTLEQILDTLLINSEYKHKNSTLNERLAYANGAMDYHNTIKKQREAMDREAGDYKI